MQQNTTYLTNMLGPTYIGERPQRVGHVAIAALAIRRDHDGHLLGVGAQHLGDGDDALHHGVQLGA